MKLKIILVGYPGSQRIVPASKYLTEKYLPGFDVTYLNYKGNVNGWANFVAGFLYYLTDKYVIFSLDDYLVSGPIDMDGYNKALAEIGGDVVCVKLCESTPEEHAEYPVTTQYCIWDREYLMSILERVGTPWEFEIHGSRMFDKKVLLSTCIPYFTNSSISSRWEGIRLNGLSEEDKNYLISNELI